MNAKMLFLIIGSSLLVLLLIFLANIAFAPKMLRLSWVSYAEYQKPPRLFNIDDTQARYIITVNSDSGAYDIIPLHPGIIDKEHPAYISSSPVPLEQFVNKIVKIKGEFVWTSSVLRQSKSSQSWDGKAAAVALTNITPVN